MGKQNAMMNSHAQPQDLRWVAAATLAAVMAGHILLETGVDALFLANISIERLPIATIAIAFFALGVSRLDGGLGHRAVLGVLQVVAAVGTFVLWFLVGTGADWVYYVLYVWSGIMTSLIVVRFWLLLGDLFTIGEGKRAFASIAMGGSIGALLGSGLSALVAPRMGGQGLLILAALSFLVSALGPMLSLSSGGQADGRRSAGPSEKGSFGESIRVLFNNPYACRVAMLVMVGGITLTLGDFLFKSVLTEEVSADDLATWLSRIYLGLNLVSIAVLAFGTTPAVRWLGVDRSQAVLPALVGLAALGSALGGALVATIFLKVADGSLRYSLHKTATELLYLPMTSALRLSVKTAIDLVGQSGAKALASLLILGLVALPSARVSIAMAVVFSSVIWIGLALSLRRSYLDVFRTTLSEGMIETVLDHPELDLESAASLIQALSDPDERRALAAMRILAERGQLDLVPNLILYHPSPQVVVGALDLFAVAKRESVRHMLGHLVHHEEARVRSATIRTTWVIKNEIEELRGYTSSDCLVVRVSAYAGLLSAGEISPEDYSAVLDEALIYESADPRLAAATSARLEYHSVNRDALIKMAKDDDLDVAHEALLAIRESSDSWFIPELVDLLGMRGIREQVRRALIEFGRPALDELAARLGCEGTGESVQVHVPRTIARFDDPDAAKLLMDGFARVESGLVRFKLIRGLETLLLTHNGRRAMHSKVDLTPLSVEFDRTLSRTQANMNLELRVKQEQEAHSDYATGVGGLLIDLLRDKRVLATGRLFMMLGLLHPTEDFRAIESGLESEDVTDRASAQELIETLLQTDVASSLLFVSGAVVLQADDHEEAIGDSAEEHYSAVLGTLLSDASETLRAVALYHAGELGLDVLATRVGEAARVAESDATPSKRSGTEMGLAAVRDLFERRNPNRRSSRPSAPAPPEPTAA